MAVRQVESLRDVFKCVICMEKLQDARLCPHCSKLCCYSCIRKWLTEQRSQCPHCRTRLHMSELVNCRWAEEVTDSIDRLQKENTGATATDVSNCRDKCNLHHEKLSVYCWTCQDCICHHCALWGGQHAGHALKPLQDEYKGRVAQVKSEVRKLRRRLCHLINVLQQIEANVEAIRRGKEERVREIRCAVELMIARLDSSMKNKLGTLTTHKQTLSVEVEMIESLVHQAEDDLANCSQSEIVKQSSDLLATLRDVQGPCLSSPITILPDFASEIIPPYDCHLFVLQSFSEMRSKAEPVYSAPLEVQGMSWRLKVYPDGNGAVRGAYLSVFLELTSGPAEAAKYEYRIDMIHRDGDSTRNIVREFASDFEVGECWGYNRFFKLEFLASEGFLDEETDSLILQFQVRAPTYYQKCKDYLWYINTLEAVRSRQQSENERLTQQLVASSIANAALHGSGEDESGKEHRLDEAFDEQSSSVQIDLLPEAFENDSVHWRTATGASDRSGSPQLCSYQEQLLPGEVPASSSNVPTGAANDGAVELAHRDVDDDSTINTNESEDLATMFLNDSLAGMNLDFTVPDREPPPNGLGEASSRTVPCPAVVRPSPQSAVHRRMNSSSVSGINSLSTLAETRHGTEQQIDSDSQDEEVANAVAMSSNSSDAIGDAHALVCTCKGKVKKQLYRCTKSYVSQPQRGDDGTQGQSVNSPQQEDGEPSGCADEMDANCPAHATRNQRDHDGWKSL